MNRINHTATCDLKLLGIEFVAVCERVPVACVDVMTLSRAHASMLEETFQIRPFRFVRGGATLHAFPRLPAASAKSWLEAQGIKFAQVSDGLRPDGPVTWVQCGFPPDDEAA